MMLSTWTEQVRMILGDYYDVTTVALVLMAGAFAVVFIMNTIEEMQ